MQLKKAVYKLIHSYEYEYEGEKFDEIKTLGIFSTKEKAQEHVDKLKNQVGFRDYPDGFYIDPYYLDKPSTLWDDGFVDADFDEEE